MWLVQGKQEPLLSKGECGEMRHERKYDGRFWLVFTVILTTDIEDQPGPPVPLPNFWLWTNRSSNYTKAAAFHRCLHHQDFVVPHPELEMLLPRFSCDLWFIYWLHTLAVASSDSNDV